MFTSRCLRVIISYMFMFTFTCLSLIIPYLYDAYLKISYNANFFYLFILTFRCPGVRRARHHGPRVRRRTRLPHVHIQQKPWQQIQEFEFQGLPFFFPGPSIFVRLGGPVHHPANHVCHHGYGTRHIRGQAFLPRLRPTCHCGEAGDCRGYVWVGTMRTGAVWVGSVCERGVSK